MVQKLVPISTHMAVQRVIQLVPTQQLLQAAPLVHEQLGILPKPYAQPRSILPPEDVPHRSRTPIPEGCTLSEAPTQETELVSIKACPTMALPAKLQQGTNYGWVLIPQGGQAKMQALLGGCPHTYGLLCTQGMQPRRGAAGTVLRPLQGTQCRGPCRARSAEASAGHAVLGLLQGTQW